MAVYNQGGKTVQGVYNGDRRLLPHMDRCVGLILYTDIPLIKIKKSCFETGTLALEVFHDFFHAVEGTPHLANIEEESHIAEDHVFHADFGELFYLTYYFIWGTL